MTKFFYPNVNNSCFKIYQSITKSAESLPNLYNAIGIGASVVMPASDNIRKIASYFAINTRQIICERRAIFKMGDCFYCRRFEYRKEKGHTVPYYSVELYRRNHDYPVDSDLTLHEPSEILS